MFYRDIDDLAIKDKLKLKIKDTLYEYKPGTVLLVKVLVTIICHKICWMCEFSELSPKKLY